MMGFKATTKRMLTGVGTALVLAVFFTELMVAFWPKALSDWFITLVATFLSVGVALALFWYQREKKSDEERQEQLLTSLSVELQMVLKILEESRRQVSVNDEELGKTVMETLPRTALEEAVRSGVYSPDWTSFLVQLNSHIQAHNDDVWHYRAAQFVPKSVGFSAMLKTRVEYVEWRLGRIEENSKNVINDLKMQGLPQPEKPIHPTA
jgi:hypothetical protein